MESPLTEECNPLPFYQQSRIKWSLHVAMVFSLAIFIGFLFIPGDDKEKIILNVFFLLLSVLFGLLWVVMGFYNKSYLRVTDDTLEHKAILGKRKVISLESIYQMDFFSIRGARFLGILVDLRAEATAKV